MKLLLALGWLSLTVSCSPVPSNVQGTPDKDAYEFMSRYGYLEAGTPNGSKDHPHDMRLLEDTLKTLQRFGNINQTGELDEATRKLMLTPRCGLPDIVQPKSKTSPFTRAKRHVVNQSGGWSKRTLTYKISSWNKYLGRDTVRTEMRKALTVWAKHGNLQFQEVHHLSSADIVVQFGKRMHGDDYPFDGPKKVLAHAFFPNNDLGGDIHFDDDETWREKPSRNSEIDLFSVAVHEVGHSLGLYHTSDTESIMFPYHAPQDSASFRLNQVDIAAMYQLYKDNLGKEFKPYGGYRTRPATTTTKTPTTRAPVRTTMLQGPTKRPRPGFTGHGYPNPRQETPPGSLDICDGHFDTISFLRNEIFVFKGDRLWRLSTPRHINDSYPTRISYTFPGLPKDLHKVDAVYENKKSLFMFFSDDKYWVHDGNRVVRGPRPISDLGLPLRRVDAITTWWEEGKTYIFSEGWFWRFDESRESVDPGYPESMQLFRGVPHDLDSAMTWSDGVTYFFKGKLFWAFNKTLLRTQPSSPQDATQHWFGCTPQELRELTSTSPLNELTSSTLLNELTSTTPLNELTSTTPLNELTSTTPLNELTSTTLLNELTSTTPLNELTSTTLLNELTSTTPLNELTSTTPLNELTSTTLLNNSSSGNTLKHHTMIVFVFYFLFMNVIL